MAIDIEKVRAFVAMGEAGEGDVLLAVPGLLDELDLIMPLFRLAMKGSCCNGFDAERTDEWNAAVAEYVLRIKGSHRPNMCPADVSTTNVWDAVEWVAMFGFFAFVVWRLTK